MRSEHEYFSPFSRQNRILQRPEASNTLWHTSPPHTTCSISFPPVQGKGHLEIHGRTFLYPPLPSPQTLLSTLELRCPCAIPGAGHSWVRCPAPPASQQCARRADPRLPPALPAPATLRSKRPALGSSAVLLGTSQHPDVFWLLTVGFSVRQRSSPRCSLCVCLITFR